MYMKSPNSHVEWKTTRDEKRYNWKEGRKDSKAAKDKASKLDPDPDSPDAAPAPSSSTLALAKSFKTALTSQVHMSDAKASFLIDKIVADAEGEKPTAKE